MRAIPKQKQVRRGQTLALLAILTVPLLSLLALVLDGGLMMASRRKSQSVADAAAMAAAYSLYKNYLTDRGLDPNGTAKSAALNIAKDNGYTNDGVTSSITVNIPPLSGNFAGQADYAEAIVGYSQPRLFSAIWGAGTLGVSARSVARGISHGSGVGILLLDPSMKNSLSLPGSGGVTVTGGDILVDSSDPQAANINSNGGATAQAFFITGGYSSTGAGQFVGTMNTGATPTPDFLASLPVPDPSSLSVQSSKSDQVGGSGNTTLYPGVYTGGISISGPGPGTVTLQPGIYYMQDGGFSISGGMSLVGNGVMIYNATSSNSQPINLAGTGAVTLSPPTSGPFQGITFFQARSSNVAVSITGNGLMNITGALYAAGAEVDLAGNGVTNNVASQVVANNMKVTGGGLVNILYNRNALPPSRDTRIVE